MIRRFTQQQYSGRELSSLSSADFVDVVEHVERELVAGIPIRLFPLKSRHIEVCFSGVVSNSHFQIARQISP